MLTRKRFTILLMMIWLSFSVLACGQNIKIVKPPLQDPPKLESVTPMKNKDVPGFWMNRPDMESVAEFFSHVKNVKDTWK